MATDKQVEAAREVYATFGQSGHLRTQKPSAEIVRAMLEAAEKAAWRSISEALPGTKALVRRGDNFTVFAAALDADVENDAGSCTAWRALSNIVFPPDWSAGTCWEINEDGVQSTKPTHFRPLPKGPSDE